MTLLSIKEFAQMCGIAPSNVHVYKNRGKLILKGGSIDIDNPLNKLFIETRRKTPQETTPIEPQKQENNNIDLSLLLTQNEEQLKATISNKELPMPLRVAAKEMLSKGGFEVVKRLTTKRKQQNEAPESTYTESFHTLNKLKANKLTEEIEIAKLKKQKMSGEVIPVNFTQMIFNLHFKNISTAFYNAADNYTTMIIEKLGGKRADLALFRTKLNELLNSAISEAKTRSKSDVKALSNEFSYYTKEEPEE